VTGRRDRGTRGQCNVKYPKIGPVVGDEAQAEIGESDSDVMCLPGDAAGLNKILRVD
jgi:hypothetical protein